MSYHKMSYAILFKFLAFTCLNFIEERLSSFTKGFFIKRVPFGFPQDHIGF